jgi:type IV secretory pathway TrbL component
VVDEVSDQQVDPDRMPGGEHVAGALQGDQRRAGELGQALRPGIGLATVVVAVDDERGARTRRQISSASSLESAKGASAAASITSGLVSKAQPTQSSSCLVECGSGSISEKKDSTKPG